jgi:hypothetical protein
MHDSEPVWVASPSPYETFIHNTLPVLTGAPKSETNSEKNQSQIGQIQNTESERSLFGTLPILVI